MKVLIVNTTPFGPGGITTVILSYYKNMNSDMDFDFVAINDKMPEMYANVFKTGGSNVYCLHRKKNIFTYILGLYKLCKKNKYDVIHVHGNSGTMIIEMLIAYMCDVPKRIAHCHNVEHGHRILNRILNPIFRKQYSVALACSQNAGIWLFGENKFTVLKNAILLNDYKFNISIRDKARKELGIESEDIVIGHVGYFNEQKNQRYIVELIKHFPNKKVKVLFVGNGLKIRDIQEYTNDSRIIFTGSTNEVNKYMFAMDLFMFPSKWEGLGIVLIEAQAAGLPCVASTMVPTEVNLTNTIDYFSLEKPDDWINYVKIFTPKSNEERTIASEKNIKALTNKGYEITNEAKKLEDIYMN